MDEHVRAPAWHQPGPDPRFVLTLNSNSFSCFCNACAQDRLSAAEAQRAELEYDMSDKSASLREATEQLAELKRQLAESRAAADAASAKAEAAAAELEQSHARAMGLATALAELEGELEGRKEEAAAQEEALAAARAEAEAQRAEAEAQRAEVESARQALAAVQQGTLQEKEQQVSGQGGMVWWVCMKVWWMCKNGAAGHSKPEWRRGRSTSTSAALQFLAHPSVPASPSAQQIILGRAELAELRTQLSEQEQAAAKLRSQLEARDGELREAKAAMATEVSEAAQQVGRGGEWGAMVLGWDTQHGCGGGVTVGELYGYG